jgi:hypothetical protein
MGNARLRLLLVLLVSVCASAWRSGAGELTLQYRRHSVEGKYLHLDMVIMGEFSFDTIDAIRNGITANLLVNLHLVRTGGIFDSGRELVGQRTENFTISYDVWDNSFQIEDKARKKEHQVVQPSDIVSEISRSMSDVRMTIPSAARSGKYIVRGRIKIQTIKLFPPFGIFLYFFDPWNYDSGWISTEVFEVETPRG